MPIAVIARTAPEALARARMAFASMSGAAIAVLLTGPAAAILAATTSVDRSWLEPTLWRDVPSFFLPATLVMAATVGWAIGCTRIGRSSAAIGIVSVSSRRMAFAKATLGAVAAALVLVAIAVIEAVRRGDGRLGVMASAVWLSLLPLRSAMLVLAIDALRVVALPRHRHWVPRPIVVAAACISAAGWSAVVLSALVGHTPLGAMAVESGWVVAAAAVLAVIDTTYALASLSTIHRAERAILGAAIAQ